MPGVRYGPGRWIVSRALLLAAIALLAYGPFFALLPVTPGFVRERHDPVVVPRRPGSPVNPAEARFAAAAREAERDIGLPFTSAVCCSGSTAAARRG